MIELERRGKLPPDKQKLLNEARKRGLVEDDTLHDGDLVEGKPNEVVDYIQQGLSGVNEGLANLTDLPKAALSIGPAIVNALGGNAAYPDYIPDVAGKAKEAMASVGMIKPPSDDRGKQVVRRIGEEVGAALIPGLGLASKAERPLRVLTSTLGSAVGGGSGAAIAEQAAPGNAGMELAGQLVGGMSPTALGAMARRSAALKAAPTVEALKDEAGQLYDKARSSGAKSTASMNTRLADDIKSIAVDEGLVSPSGKVSTAYPKLSHALDVFEDYKSGDMNVAQMLTVRKTLTDAAGSADASERRIAMKMLDRFDAHTSKLAPELAEGNAIYTKAKKGQLIEQAIELAGSRAGQFSGSGFENALRTEFRGLERQIIKGDLKGLSQEEIDAITKVAQGGGVENIARWFGKFAPSGNLSTVSGAMAGNALGGFAGAGAVLGAGALGRSVATKMAAGNAAKASALMRRGTAALGPVLDDTDARALTAIGTGQAANQNSASTTMTLSEWSKRNGAVLAAGSTSGL